MNAAAQAAKAAGMAQVDDAANERWKIIMDALVEITAKDMQFFTADDVFDRYDLLQDKPKTHDKRAFGPVMMRAAKRLVCKKSSLPHRLSRRASLHASPRQVWESLIYKGLAQ